jgi:hypothetical protein
MSGMPEDIMLITTDGSNVDPVTLVNTGSNRRLQMETKAKEGQKKQAEYVNKSRGGDCTDV